MAGSYLHAVDDDGKLLNWKNMAMVATETGGDAYETIQEMYGMIWFLADGEAEMVESARRNYQLGLEMSPGAQDS
jgi:hypothetical protein